MATDYIIGQNIRRARLLLQLSQGDIGDYLGITSQQVQKYEQGTNRISAVALYRLAALFQCSMEKLCSGIPVDAADMGPLSAATPDNAARKLLAAFRRIRSQRIRHRICELVCMIADGAMP